MRGALGKAYSPALERASVRDDVGGEKNKHTLLAEVVAKKVVLVCDGNDRGGRVFNVAKEMLQCGDDAVVCCLFRAVLASNAEAASIASGEHDASIGFLPVVLDPELSKELF